MIIQFIILIFIIFVFSRIIYRFKKGDITVRELFIWFIFWLGVAGAVIMPKKTDIIARLVGVERGADLLVYLSIIVLFFIVFKIIVKVEKIDRNITEIVRQAALEKDKENE